VDRTAHVGTPCSGAVPRKEYGLQEKEEPAPQAGSLGAVPAWQERTTASSHKCRKRTHTLINVVEESYLRSDIACASGLCCACPPAATSALSPSATHYMVPDAEAVLAFLEVLELPEVTDIVMLSSVVQARC